MKDISRKTVYILLVIYLIAIITQIFFTVNYPLILTGKASTAKISLIIQAPPAPPPPPPPGPAPPRIITCTQKWECTDWGLCQSSGLQYRTCTDINDCENKLAQKLVDRILRIEKPGEQRTCTYIPPVEKPFCYDGIQNQDETDVDCGGICGPTCKDGQRCRTDMDCINKCDAETGICYSLVPLLPPIIIRPVPMPIWQRLWLIISFIIKYLILKWMFTLPIIIILLVYLFMLLHIKIKLRLISMKKDKSVWKYRKFTLTVSRIKSKKKLEIDLEIEKGKKYMFGTITLSNILSGIDYSIKAIVKGYNPIIIYLLLSELKRRLREKYD